eukprot:GEMP01002314.1.p1 GENE.GEMP01002314.1~~GEMP01002314.1.p1  ORF type:complete len:865 (+),score=115.34 GEMP01002314.1:73-2667(+)
MGNQSSALKNDYKKALSRFNRGKVALVRSIFRNLTEHSTTPGKTVDKTTFLKYFPLPGMMGERLFSVFDRDNSGAIDFQEFLTGMGLIYRGTVEEKKRFLFEMYDLDGDGVVTREELHTMLSHIPSAFKILDAAMEGDRSNIDMSEDPETKSRIRNIVDSAFKKKGEGENLTFDEFIRIVNKTPEVLEIINVFYDEALPEHDFACRTSKITEGPLPRVSIWATVPVARLAPQIRVRDVESVTPRRPSVSSPKTRAEDGQSINIVGSPSSRATGALRKVSGWSLNSVASGLQACMSLTLKDNAGSKDGDDASQGSDHTPSTLSSGPVAPLEGGHGGQMCPMCHTAVMMHHCMKCGNLLTTNVGGKELFCEGCDWEVETIRFCFRCGQPLKRMLMASFSAQATVPASSPAEPNLYSVSTSSSSEIPTAKSAPTFRVITSNQLGRAGTASDSCARATPVPDAAARYFGTANQPNSAAQMSGEMSKIGRNIKTLRTRYFVLRDRFLYYYRSLHDMRPEAGPKGVIFLEGAFVRSLPDQGDHRCALEIRNTTTKRIYHCKTNEERDHWVEALGKASKNNYFVNDFYDITTTVLGKGKFAVVYLGIRKEDKVDVAIKVISKVGLGEDCREFIRTEIAVLKLVHHPNLVTMVDMFDETERLYLVMERVGGGDLLRRLLSLPSKRVSEKTSQVICLHLVRAVRFLHEHGITHRDLKPENVLIVDPIDEDPIKNARITSVKVTDFGLSAITRHAMDAQLGTVAYAAPEILKNQQYDRQVDMWSLGAIAFIVLSGELPFRGRTLKDIAQSTIRGDYSFRAPIWAEISPDAKNFVSSLLRLKATERLTAMQLINHPWLSTDLPDMRQSRSKRSMS